MDSLGEGSVKLSTSNFRRHIPWRAQRRQANPLEQTVHPVVPVFPLVVVGLFIREWRKLRSGHIAIVDLFGPWGDLVNVDMQGQLFKKGRQ